MRIPRGGPSPRTVAFIDIGTNSIRLFVVRVNPDCSFAILTSQKEPVRLGEGEFPKGTITPEAMDRAVLVAGKFVEIARSFNVDEYVSVATSATREAKNRFLFLSRLRKEAGLDTRIISGREEARLIFMGVSSALTVKGHDIMVIDIGGGSTEIAIGSDQACGFLASFRLGTIRLANIFFPEGAPDIVPMETYRDICRYVRNEIRPMVQKGPDVHDTRVVGSSGTLINIRDIAARSYHEDDPDRTTLSLADLEELVPVLCRLPLRERRRIPGINPERADIIIPGAAIIQTIMEEMKIPSLEISQRGLQDGLLVDYMTHLEGFPLIGSLSAREKSVLLTGREFGINEFHARTVAKIALDLFDSGRRECLHNLGEEEREILEYAAFLHDTGSVISFRNHHFHSCYIIRNSDLLGFTPEEIRMIAYIARYHRKKFPRKDMTIPGLGEDNTKRVLILSVFVRLAEVLDRRHAALIDRVAFTRADPVSVELRIFSREDCLFESWGIEKELKIFERIFQKKLSYRFIQERDKAGEC